MKKLFAIVAAVLALSLGACASQTPSPTCGVNSKAPITNCYFGGGDGGGDGGGAQ
jgi:hypothetical protein